MLAKIVSKKVDETCYAQRPLTGVGRTLDETCYAQRPLTGVGRTLDETCTEHVFVHVSAQRPLTGHVPSTAVGRTLDESRPLSSSVRPTTVDGTRSVNGRWTDT